MGLNAIEIEQSRKEIAATAEAMLVDDCSYIEGTRTICGLLDRAQVDQFEEPFVTFVGINSETDFVPLGWLREHWHAGTRGKNEAEWSEAEKWAATYGEGACREAISWVGLHSACGN
jgi:hypothetical protein